MMKFRVNLDDKSVDFINGLFLILKHIIHKCKVLKTVPPFNVLKVMRSDKAYKVFDLFNKCEFV